MSVTQVTSDIRLAKTKKIKKKKEKSKRRKKGEREVVFQFKILRISFLHERFLQKLSSGQCAFFVAVSRRIYSLLRRHSAPSFKLTLLLTVTLLF